MKLPVSVHRLQPLSAIRLNIQQGVLKWPIYGSAILAAAFMTTSCVPEPYPGGGYPGPGQGNGPGWSGSESSAYRAGHSDGSRDKRQGRRYNPYKGNKQLPPATRDDYVRGYNAGFKNANDNPWNQRRAYELGQDRGRRDRQAGRSMNPERHVGEVPAAVRNDYRRGYREGWNASGSGPIRPRPPRPTPY